jgi:hypothetical protein
MLERLISQFKLKGQGQSAAYGMDSVPSYDGNVSDSAFSLSPGGNKY